MRQHLKIRHNFMALNSVPLCNIKVACLGFFFFFFKLNSLKHRLNADWHSTLRCKNVLI